MQSVSSRNWTQVAVSISYDDNHYGHLRKLKIINTLGILGRVMVSKQD